MKKRQWLLSVVIFAAIIVALVSVDERVQDQVNSLISGGNGISSWHSRAADLGSAVAGAIRTQSIDSAPLLLFATVGVVLFVFMVRT